MTALADGVLAHLRQVTGTLDLTETPYRLVRPIGRGGMGAVYLVLDTRLARRVALKVLDVLGDEDLGLRLEHEARVIARLEHPNIVPVHDVGRLPDGRVYYAMKYVRGKRLDEWLSGAPPRAASLRMFQRICEAVAFAHARGVVHRDLKPQNIMVGAFGEALVMDWGLAREGAAAAASDPQTPSLDPQTPPLDPLLAAADTLPAPRPSSTGHGTLLGTPGYMSPEQARGETSAIDERSDVFALGAILYFLLAGRAAFPGDSVEDVMRRTLDDEPPPLSRAASDVPRPLASIVTRALQKRPEDRYRSAGDMAADVAAWLDGLPVTAHRETVPERLARWYARYNALVLVLAAYLAMRTLVALIARR